MVGSVFVEDDQFEMRSHLNWNTPRSAGYVCAAGIAGNVNCNNVTMAEVMRANVGLPVTMMRLARLIGAPLIMLSSTSIYASSVQPCKEGDDVYPYNRYTASKIAMEYAVSEYDKCYILRLPFVVLFDGAWNFGTRCLGWQKCEAILMSVVYRQTLLSTIKCILGNDIRPGIYNIASEVVGLPNLVRKFGWDGEVVRAGMLGLCPCPRVDLTKAKVEGLL